MGRPLGSKNASTILQEAVLNNSEKQILEEFPKIVKAVVDKAKAGDLKAAKMLMDRVIPVRKAIEHRNTNENKGVTIIVQGIPQVEEGKPVIEVKPETENLEKLEVIEHENES